jgi:hypothetical protein
MATDDSLIDAAARARLDADHRAIDDLSPAQPTGPDRIDDDRGPEAPAERTEPQLKDDRGHRMTHGRAGKAHGNPDFR